MLMVMVVGKCIYVYILVQPIGSILFTLMVVSCEPVDYMFYQYVHKILPP